MKIIITNATGSQQDVAEMNESGVIFYVSGEVGHVLFEKNFNKKIELAPDTDGRNEERLETKTRSKSKKRIEG